MELDKIEITKDTLLVITVPPVLGNTEYDEISSTIAQMKLDCPTLIIPEGIGVFDAANMDDDLLEEMTRVRNALNISIAKYNISRRT